MPIFRVVVDDEFRIARDDLPGIRDDERIDLHEFGILLSKDVVALPRDRRHLVTNVRREPELLREAPEDVRLDADHRGDVFHEELVPRDGFDLHPTHRTRHQEGLPGRAVDREAEVQLLRDVQPFFQVDLFHLVPVDVEAEDLPRHGTRLVHRLRGPDAARFAPTSHENLGLDHARERWARDLFRWVRDDAPRDRNPVPREDLLRLVLEELHPGRGADVRTSIWFLMSRLT